MEFKGGEVIANVDRLKATVEKMKEILKFPVSLHPSPYIEDIGTGIESDHILIKNCAMCKTTFLLLDVVIAPCKCAYHPWCVASQNRLEGKCANQVCAKKFTK